MMKELLKQKQIEFEKLLEKIELKDVFFKLGEGMSYSLFAGGKRLRPIILLEIANAYNADKTVAEGFALAIEMIHTYSLIHDDLPSMDNDDLRRGIPTNHAKFGEGNAVLAGDALLNLAFETAIGVCKSEKDIAALAAIAKASGAYGMCGGQSADLYFEKRQGTLSDLRYIDERKTGALLSAAIKIGAILGTGTETELSILNEYAENYGLLFQITDDLLDFTSDNETLGKTANKDLRDGKLTYVTLLGVDKAREYAEKVRELCVVSAKKLRRGGNFLEELAEYTFSRLK